MMIFEKKIIQNDSKYFNRRFWPKKSEKMMISWKIRKLTQNDSKLLNVCFLAENVDNQKNRLLSSAFLTKNVQIRYGYP